MWGARYIDDLVGKRSAAVAVPPEATPDPAWWWPLTDVQYSVVATLNEWGYVHERTRYDAYGAARHRWAGDFDGDGDVDSADELALANASYGETWLGGADYRSDYDVDRDGYVDNFADFAAAGGVSRAALTPGAISDDDPDGPDLPIGYCGYVFEPVSGMYCVRFRWYEPGLGRWVQRDPAGYVDGMGVYEYVRAKVLILRDPHGLRGGPDDGHNPIQEVEQYLDGLERSGRQLRYYDTCSLGELPAWVEEYEKWSEYGSCLVDCIKNDPGRLAAALAQAGWNVGKDFLPDVGPLLLVTLFSANQEGRGELDFENVAECLADSANKANDCYSRSLLKRMRHARESISASLWQWTMRGTDSPAEEVELLQKLKRVKDTMNRELFRSKFTGSAAREIRRSAKLMSRANFASNVLEATYEAVKQIQEACKDKCARPCAADPATDK